MTDIALPTKLVAGKPSRAGIAEAQKGWTVLIVSSDAENRNALLSILEGLPIHTYVAATLEEGRAILSKSLIDVVFCDESLPDGSYRRLLDPVMAGNRTTRFVVTLCTGEWDEYLEAMRLGATDVLRCPLQSIEVELVLIRAGRERDQHGFDVMA